MSLWVGPKKTKLQDPFYGEGVLICDPSLIQIQTLRRKMARQGMIFSRTIQSSSLEVITRLVSTGAGVGLLPNRTATLNPSLGLKLRSTKDPEFVDKICLVYRADAQKSKASKLISSYISKRLQGKV